MATTMTSSIPGLPEGCATDELSGSVASMMSQALDGALINEEELIASGEASEEALGFTEGTPALHTPVISERSAQQPAHFFYEPTTPAPAPPLALGIPAICAGTPRACPCVIATTTIQPPALEPTVRRFVSAGPTPCQGVQRLVSGPALSAHSMARAAGYPVITRHPTLVNPPITAGMITPATPMTNSVQQTPATPMLSPASQQTVLPEQPLQSPRLSPRVSVAYPVRASPIITPRGSAIPVGTGSMQLSIGTGSMQLSVGTGSVQLTPRQTVVHRPTSAQMPAYHGALQMQVQSQGGYSSVQAPVATPPTVHRLPLATSMPATGNIQVPPATWGAYQVPTPRSVTIQPGTQGSFQVPPGAIQQAGAYPAFSRGPVEIYRGNRSVNGYAGNSKVIPGSPVLAAASGDARASPSEPRRSPRSQGNGSPSVRSGASGQHSPSRPGWSKCTRGSELEMLAPQKEAECEPSSPRLRNRESFRARRDRALVPDPEKRKNSEASRSPSPPGGGGGQATPQMSEKLPWVAIQVVRTAEKELRYSQPEAINKSFVNSLRPEEPEFKPDLPPSAASSPLAPNLFRRAREPGLGAGSNTPRNAALGFPARGAATPRGCATPRGSATPRGYATPRGAALGRTACRA